MPIDSSDMAIAAVNEPVEKRLRSPSVPFIGLITAIGRARELYDRAGQNGLSVADAASAWKLRATSSATPQTVAALFAYGLAEVAGSGGARRIRISEPAGRLLTRPPLPLEARQQIIAEAALKPKLIAHYAAKWREERPDDAICIDDLKTWHGFTEAAAARFLQVFDETMQLLRFAATWIGPDNELESGVAMAPGSGETAAQDREGLHIVQRDRRLEIKADIDLAGLRELFEILLHYRTILARPLPTAAQPEPGGASTATPEPASEGGEQPRRAPFPVHGLGLASGPAASLHSRVGHGAISVAEAAMLWEVDPHSEVMSDNLSSLVHYGLAKQTGSGNARKIHLTQLGLRIIDDDNPMKREWAFREAAGTPKLLADYAARWPTGICGRHRRIVPRARFHRDDGSALPE